MGSFDIPHPVAEVTDELSSIGGGILSHFTITFDQEDDEVFFQHDAADSLAMPAVRGTGMSFQKTPAYWKVAGVIAGSPADAGGVRTGDLVSRINGEPVDNWDLNRYGRLIATSERVEFTFIEGAQGSAKSIQVVELVP
jgi:C-terminal processing protease CtpA/Prc